MQHVVPGFKANGMDAAPERIAILLQAVIDVVAGEADGRPDSVIARCRIELREQRIVQEGAARSTAAAGIVTQGQAEGNVLSIDEQASAAIDKRRQVCLRVAVQQCARPDIQVAQIRRVPDHALVRNQHLPRRKGTERIRRLRDGARAVGIENRYRHGAATLDAPDVVYPRNGRSNGYASASASGQAIEVGVHAEGSQEVEDRVNRRARNGNLREQLRTEFGCPRLGRDCLRSSGRRSWSGHSENRPFQSGN